MKRFFSLKLIVSVFVFAVYLSQGLVLGLCDHSQPKQDMHGHCHEAKTEKTTTSSHAQWSKTEANNCLMCLSGNCIVTPSSAILSIVDGVQASSELISYWNPPVWGTVAVFAADPLPLLRAPPPNFLLPQFRDWQAFFSIFRN